jgi:hypothetical protein
MRTNFNCTLRRTYQLYAIVDFGIICGTLGYVDGLRIKFHSNLITHTIKTKIYDALQAFLWTHLIYSTHSHIAAGTLSVPESTYLPWNCLTHSVKLTWSKWYPFHYNTSCAHNTCIDSPINAHIIIQWTTTRTLPITDRFFVYCVDYFLFPLHIHYTSS